ncbi:hypothetical protein D3C72_2105830 [compost metagenome]
MVGMAGLEHPVLDFHQVVARGVVVHQRQCIGALPGQAAGGQVGLVAQPRHGRGHPFACFGAHVGLVVEHAGHGLDRNARDCGDILDSTTHGAVDPM